MYGPQVIREIAQGKTGRALEDMLIKPSRLIVLIGGTILFGFFAVGKQFIAILYGDSYLIAWDVALIIMSPMLINMSNGILVNVLDAKNLRMARSWVLLVTTIGNIILTVLWIDKFGIIGACLATAVCTLAGQIFLMNLYYIKKLGVNVYYMYRKTFSGLLIPQIVASVGSYYIAKMVSNIYMSFLCGGIVYIVMFTVFFGVSKTNETEVAAIRKKMSHVLGGKNNGTFHE